MSRYKPITLELPNTFGEDDEAVTAEVAHDNGHSRQARGERELPTKKPFRKTSPAVDRD